MQNIQWKILGFPPSQAEAHIGWVPVSLNGKCSGCEWTFWKRRERCCTVWLLAGRESTPRGQGIPPFPHFFFSVQILPRCFFPPLSRRPWLGMRNIPPRERVPGQTHGPGIPKQRGKRAVVLQILYHRDHLWDPTICAVLVVTSELTHRIVMQDISLQVVLNMLTDTLAV